MSTRSLRGLAALGAVVGTGALDVPALAHAPVVGTFPAKGASATSVRTVSVRFGESVVTGLISVSGGDGRELRALSGRSGLDPHNRARLRATFPRRLSSGRYTVKWRARADDGHSEKGTFTFRVR